MSVNGQYRDLEIDVFFDFQCPFVNAAATWLHNVEQELGYPLKVNWRFFPLEQVNRAQGEDWKLWEQPDTYRSKGLPAFRAAIAARLQGEQQFRDFVWELLKLRHQEGKDLARPATLEAAAQAAGLDLEKFNADRADRSHLAEIGADYEEAVSKYGVFGTPTFVFPNGQAVYLKFKLGEVPQGQAAVEFLKKFIEIGRDTPNVLEIKRPTAPVPAAV